MASKKQGSSSRGNAKKAATKKAAKKAAPRKRAPRKAAAKKSAAPQATRTAVIEADGSAELAAGVEARSPGVSSFMQPRRYSKAVPGSLAPKIRPAGES